MISGDLEVQSEVTMTASLAIKTEQADQEVEMPLTPPTKGEDKMLQLSAEESDCQSSPGKSLDNN